MKAVHVTWRDAQIEFQISEWKTPVQTRANVLGASIAYAAILGGGARRVEKGVCVLLPRAKVVISDCRKTA